MPPKEATQKSITIIENYKNLYNISSLASILFRENTEFLAYIDIEEGQIELWILGCQTGTFLLKHKFINVQHFIDGIPKFFDFKFKAIILQVFDFADSKFKNNVEFCEALKTKLDATKVPYYFLSELNALIGKAIVAANASGNVGDNLVFIFPETGCAMIFEFTKDGYKFIQEHDWSKVEDSAIQVYANFHKPKNVLITYGPNQQKFMNALKSFSPFLMDQSNHFDYLEKFLMEVMKWMADKNYKKFHVIPMSPWEYKVGYEFGEKKLGIITVPRFVSLPIEASGSCSKSCFNHFVGYSNDAMKFIKHAQFKLTEDAHDFKITLKVDINNFPSYHIESIVYNHIVNFPLFCDNYKIDGNELKNYPIIGILGNRSFICLHKNGKFQFLESWGGQWGTPMQISFAKEKPEFDQAAEEALAKNGKYGVQDLLRIMSEGIEAPTKIDPHGYTFTKDEKNPILIEFETFSGKKKTITPEFLVAMIMKEQFKAIQNETGQKPASIAYCIFNEISENAMKNIRGALSKACEIMQIKDYCFLSCE